MFAKRLFIFVVAGCLWFGEVYSQSNVAVGGWKVHSNYSVGCDADIIDNHLFYASKSGVMRIDLQDNSMQPITKVEGMSDVGIQCARASQSTKSLVICYSNSNIDVYQNGRISNIPDIYNRQMSGDKTIYSIFTHDKYAYLACGFGIVVLDLKKKIISDSWTFRQNNQDFPVKDLLITQDGTIYAATDHALLKNKISNPNIKNFTSWEKLNNINTPNNNLFKQLASINNHLFLLKTDTTAVDTVNAIYSYKNNVWEKDSSFTFDEQGDPRFTYIFIRSSLDKLIVGSNFGTKSFFLNPSDNSIQTYDSYCPWCYNAVTAIHGKDDATYIVTSGHGLFGGKKGSHDYYDMQGPANGAVGSMDWKNSKLAMTHNTSSSWGIRYNQGYVSFLENNFWTTTSLYDDFHDIIHVVIAPYDNSVVFATSLVQGLLEYKDNSFVTLYNKTNSSLDVIAEANDGGTVRTTSPVFDKDNNLWLGNWGAVNPLAVRMKDGTWRSYSIPFEGMRYIEKIVVDSRNILWLICQKETRLVLFNPNGEIGNQWRNMNLTIPPEKGDIGHVYTVAEDKEGKIWLGTDKGIKYYSRSSSELFKDPNILPEPITITVISHDKTDTLTELMLAADPIKCIKIDAGNRKWVGTANAGVYLLSEDCRKEIFHFTTENSPLLSNTIHAIEIDGETGEVFFGTENGLISFRYTATDPKETYEALKIFPNPVREDFNGYICIEGLKEKSEVKITDAYGGLVYRTVSNGGTASWNGRRFDGQKVATGVYFVFVSDEYGQERMAGKVLVVK